MKHPLFIAHLDLKGVQYKHDYYHEYFDKLKKLNFGAVIVEYEDVFPFQSISFSRNPQEVWSHSFLKSFLEIARAKEIEIIPLQQCLSHLEYAFQWPDNRRFCLSGGTPRDLDIGKKEAREWLRRLLEEMLAAHTTSKFVHLGMDEAQVLLVHAKAAGKDVMTLFLDYLEELCEVCKKYGKTPLIWSDMLEDHIDGIHLERILSFRDKVVLVPWYYAEDARPQEVVRFSGMRCSDKWFSDPESAPIIARGIRDNLLRFENWQPEIQELVAEYRVSPWQMESLFQAAVWKKLGFTVFGAAGAGITQDRSTLPYYNWRTNNIARWKECVENYDLDGLIMTQWARSTSCSVPNVIPDVVWPLLARASNDNNSATAFFPEIDAKTLDTLIFKIGKCREDWSIENTLIQEMRELQPKIQQYSYEWATILLMLRIWSTRKAIDESKDLAECFAGIGRLVDIGWNEQKQSLISLKREMQELLDEARTHLEKRYFGHALEEWFYKVFTTAFKTIDQTMAIAEESIATFERKGLPILL